MAASMRPYRDEMCISTKAGYGMWPGPYGTKNGSRKYLISSLDQSLARMGLEYVDIFYHHVPDPETPVEETALALDQIVRSGKALYGIAENRGQTLSQLALAWCLRDARVATVLAGASRAEQVRENALAAQNTAFSAEEISAIEEILG